MIIFPADLLKISLIITDTSAYHLFILLRAFRGLENWARIHCKDRVRIDLKNQQAFRVGGQMLQLRLLPKSMRRRPLISEYLGAAPASFSGTRDVFP